jgi:hypothetical protein
MRAQQPSLSDQELTFLVQNYETWGETASSKAIHIFFRHVTAAILIPRGNESPIDSASIAEDYQQSIELLKRLLKSFELFLVTQSASSNAQSASGYGQIILTYCWSQFCNLIVNDYSHFRNHESFKKILNDSTTLFTFITGMVNASKSSDQGFKNSEGEFSVDAGVCELRDSLSNRLEIEKTQAQRAQIIRKLSFLNEALSAHLDDRGFAKRVVINTKNRIIRKKSSKVRLQKNVAMWLKFLDSGQLDSISLSIIEKTLNDGLACMKKRDNSWSYPEIGLISSEPTYSCAQAFKAWVKLFEAKVRRTQTIFHYKGVRRGAGARAAIGSADTEVGDLDGIMTMGLLRPLIPATLDFKLAFVDSEDENSDDDDASCTQPVP